MAISCTKKRPGTVTIVGAGPGDPDLLTVKAVRTITNADVILYDALVSEEIQTYFPASADCIYVGKRKGRHAIPQQQINQMLVDQAQMGLNVCRLKGGDPFVFGRGGEEALAVRAAGIEVQIVPGISAANGCAAYAGIPLTHRGLTQGCTFVTAHTRAESGVEIDSSVNWASLASSGNTLVFYMGLSRVDTIQNQLQKHGLSGATPVAIIERGCTEQQRVHVAQLANLEALVATNEVAAPALIVVGEVVSLHSQLNWLAEVGTNQVEQLTA
ncbi:uroporphyrinogen-III C-methyltransferase [Halioxenophilus sp. WMMB6]|uniref:uroporphyrinogen-III C-methyltransferase n=1 Tax=Halioxenophilus sp. WMMB6 TaxID=3073815 RepID=UPI00295F5921|nr:uroporphyrinogen-III C-methyltransferase [Halioxenophilus sp. WMMB6]